MQQLRILLGTTDRQCAQIGADLDHSVTTVADVATLQAKLARDNGRYPILLLDNMLAPAPDQAAQPLSTRLIRQIKSSAPDAAIIAFVNEDETAPLELLRAGAYYCLTKPLNLEELTLIIERAQEHSQLKQAARQKRVAEQNETQRARKLEAIQAVSTAISSTLTLDNVLQKSCQAAVELFHVDHSGLVIFDDNLVQGRVAAEYPPLIKTVGTIIPLRGVPAEEQLIASQQTLAIEDVAGADSLDVVRDILLGFDIQSILFVPIVFQERVLGSFSLDAVGQSRVFTAEEADLCQIFASQVGVAIANAQLLTEAQQRAEQLESLRQTTLALTSNLSRESLLQTIIKQAIELLDAKSGGIDVFHPDRDCLEIVAEYGRATSAVGQTIHLGKGITGVLVDSSDPHLIVDNYYQWSQRIESFASQRAYGSVLAVKLKWQKQIIGVLYVDDEVGRAFSANDARLLRLFADHAAIALVNADLAAKDIDKLNRLEKLSLASREMMDNLEDVSLRDRLNLITRRATEIVQAEACSILLVKRPGFLSFEACFGYTEGSIELGREFAIRSGKQTGLTGHIAHEKTVFNARGAALRNHFAVKGEEKPHVVSGQCYSLLALPLMVNNGQGKDFIGLLRLDNKKNKAGETNPNFYFDQEDEWIANLFVDAAVGAIESAGLIEQLSRQKALRDRLITNSPSGVVANDRHGRITIFNEQAQAIMGYQPEEMIGQSITRLYADQEEPRKIGRLLHEQDSKLRGYETAVLNQEGERIPIRLAATWLFDTQGERVGAVGYFEDLRAIKETRRRLSLLLKASNVVAQAGSLANGLQRLARMMVTSLDMKFCLILILDESRQFLVSEAIFPQPTIDSHGDKLPVLGKRIAVADWASLAEFLTGGGATVLRAGDKWQQQILAKLPLHLGLLEEEIQSILTLPLRTGERNVGLLYLGETRRWQRVPFSNDKLELAMAIADQTAVLIERNQLHETTKRREQLLATLDETSRHIRGEKETRKLWPEIVRLAAKLAQCSSGGLFINQLHLEEVVLRAAYGLPPELMDRRLPHGQGLIGQVAATGQAIVTNEYGRWPDPDRPLLPLNLQTMAAVPLKQAGEVEAVLFVADTSSRHWVNEIDLEILKRLAVQASIALQTSRLMGSEQRMFAQLAILHRISDYIQGTDDLQKILHVVLTGVTAGYGLGFNRASLILLDETGQWLVGSMGIGHLDQTLASQSWKRDHRQGLYDFGVFLEKLEKDELPLTPIGERILTIRHPLQSTKTDAFSRVIVSCQYLRLEPEQFHQLPPAFVDIFEPVTSLVIAPLMVRGEAIGLLVADNKFTWSPITDGDIELLLTFANTAAVAIDRTRLFHEAQAAREQIRSLYAASDALILTQGASKVLLDRIEQAQRATEAAGVSVILIDELGQIQDFYSTGFDLPAQLADFERPDEFSLQVMHTGQPKIINDTAKLSDQAGPNSFWQKAGAALCVPLAIGSSGIGVIWVYYDRPRLFSETDIDALQLYANQTAVAYDSARHINELEHMRQAAESLAGVTELPKVLEQIVHSAREVLQADVATIYSYDSFRNRFVVENSVATGIPLAAWQKMRQDVPRADGTANFVMDNRWVGIKDISNEQQYPFIGKTTRKILGNIGIKSFQGVALIVDDEKLGVLYVSYKRYRSFSQEEREAAQTFANHAALALKKAKLLYRVHKAQNTARTVARVTTLEDLNRTLESIVAETKNALNCDAVTLYVYNPYREQLNYPPTMIGVRYPKRALRLSGIEENSIVFTMLAQAKMYIAKNTAEDEYFQGRRFTTDEEVKSCVAIPLRVGAESVGVMFVNYRQPHRFPTDELDDIELFANQAAVAIHNAQLYEREQSRTAALQALYNATRAITGSLDLGETLHRILEQAWQLVNYHGKQISYASIWLVEEESKVRLVAAFPTEEFSQTQARLGSEIDWRKGKGGRVGIMGKVIQSGKSKLVQDVTQDPDYLESHPQTRSALAVPICLEKKVIGIINVEHSDYEAFDDENAQTLQSLADQAAIAIQNTRLYQTSVRHVKLLNVAATVANHATSILEEEKLLTETIYLIADRLNFYHVAVFLLDEKHEYAVLRAASSEGGQKMLASGHKLRVGEEGIIGSVAQSGKPRLTSNVEKDEQHLANVHLSDTRSEMTFPLIARGQVIGVLDVQSKETVTLQQEETSTLQTMANILANAIENSQLFNREQKRAATSQALYEAGQALTGSLDLDYILQTVTEQAWKLTGAIGLTAQFSHLILVNGSKLQLSVTYPPDHLIPSQEAVGTIDLERDGRIGVTGRVVKTGKPQFVSDVRQDDDYIAANESIRSEVAVPIKIGDNVIAVINVEHSEPNAFDEDDLQALVLLASQAAVVIQNTQAYQEAEVLQRVAASLAGPMELIEALNLVMTAAIELTNTDAGSILFWNEDGEHFAPAFTTTADGQLEIYKTSARPHGGIARRIITSGEPAIVPDTHTLPNVNPTAIKKKRRAFIGVPLFSKATTIGVLFVSCVEPRHFSQHQVKLLQTLVSQAVVAIIVARRYEELNAELKKAKGLVGARTALAWMGMASNAWRHSIEGDAVNIRNSVTLLRPQVETAVSHPSSLAQISDKLDRIERLAEKILGKPITPPLSSEDGVEAVIINDLIHERMRQLWEDDPYYSIDGPFLHLDTTADIQVWVSPEWLRLALDLVVDNAVEAMQSSEIQQLDITTRLIDDKIEIAVKDTGKGIPPEIQALMFGDPSDQPKRDGHLGRGLLMVQAIVQTYGGDVRIGKTGPEGTAMILSFPVLQEP